MFVEKTGRIPVKYWIDEGDIEDGARNQARNISSLPFVFRHIAIMPDAHQGYGMPIGGVMATLGYIVPNAVGVDIGCGMCAVKTSIRYKNIDVDTIKKIMGEIRRVIPVGFNKHSEVQVEDLMPDRVGSYNIVSKEWKNALKSIGTLGGGNHFIEIQRDDSDYIWIMIHSGSRNLGFKVANYYNELAISLNEKYHSSVPKSHELAFLPIRTKEAQMYLTEMNYCVEFALANRSVMMDRIQDVFLENVDSVQFEEMINIAHNYARLENHFGKNVWVHRKGATSARGREIGIIPGSQGTCSYIVRGLGNKESFMSCSHGAGRLMGRRHAKETLVLDEQVEILDRLGVIHGMRHKDDLDEAPGSYKDIEVVMENQRDLVEIVEKLRPVAVIKG